MRIRILREAGGIGDVVRCSVVSRALRAQYPGAEVWAYIAEPFVDLWRRAAPGDRIIPVALAERRPRHAAPDAVRYPYLARVPAGVAAPWGRADDLTIDLYCPALAHELAQGRQQWLDRIDLFCRAAGVAPRDRRPQLTPFAVDEVAAESALARAGLGESDRGRSCIALQPFSTDPGRDWPVGRWRELAGQLARLRPDIRVFVLDSCAGRTRTFPLPRICGQPLPVVAAILKRCSLLIAPDSGLFHLAAAVGTPAVGLFASQSGGIVSRHYPQHTYVQPPADAACPGGGSWPCFWQRPAECVRAHLKATGRTCAALARIVVEDVCAAALAVLDNGSVWPSALLPDTTASAGGETVPIISRPDASCDRVVMERSFTPAAFREAFRVLRVGGELLVVAATELAALPGMVRLGREVADGRQLTRWRKVDTWPRPGAG